MEIRNVHLGQLRVRPDLSWHGRVTAAVKLTDAECQAFDQTGRIELTGYTGEEPPKMQYKIITLRRQGDTFEIIEYEISLEYDQIWVSPPNETLISFRPLSQD